MTQFFKKGQWIKREEYTLSYHYQNDPGAGCSFPCDKEGTLFLPLPAQANYERCLRGEGGLVPDGVVTYDTSYYDPPIIACQCGRSLTLYNAYEEECVCGRLYNGFGQLLAPREQWEHEGGQDYPDDWEVGE